MLLELGDHPGFIQKTLEPILKVLPGDPRMRHELAGLAGTAGEAARHVFLDCHPAREALVPGQIGDGETARAKRAAHHVLFIEQGAKRKLESHARRVCFIKTAMRANSRAAAVFHASHA